MDGQTLTLLVQVGEATLPLVEAGVNDVLAFAKANGGNAETIAQLEQNATTIAQDAETIDQELAADGIKPVDGAGDAPKTDAPDAP